MKAKCWSNTSSWLTYTVEIEFELGPDESEAKSAQAQSESQVKQPKSMIKLCPLEITLEPNFDTELKSWV